MKKKGGNQSEQSTHAPGFDEQILTKADQYFHKALEIDSSGSSLRTSKFLFRGNWLLSSSKRNLPTYRYRISEVNLNLAGITSEDGNVEEALVLRKSHLKVTGTCRPWP